MGECGVAQCVLLSNSPVIATVHALGAAQASQPPFPLFPLFPRPPERQITSGFSEREQWM